MKTEEVVILTDVTERLLSELDSALGPEAKRLRKVRPAKNVEGQLSDIVTRLQDPHHDNTLGFVSKPLLYSNFFRGKPARYHDDIIRLLKGGWLLVIEVPQKPEPGTKAAKDSPYGDRYYNLELNPEKI